LHAWIKCLLFRQLQNGKNILEKMGRDNRFYSPSGEEKEEDTLASQVRINQHRTEFSISLIGGAHISRMSFF
jgi:hypothetical protein